MDGIPENFNFNKFQLPGEIFNANFKLFRNIKRFDWISYVFWSFCFWKTSFVSFKYFRISKWCDTFSFAIEFSFWNKLFEVQIFKSKFPFDRHTIFFDCCLSFEEEQKKHSIHFQNSKHATEIIKTGFRRPKNVRQSASDVFF